MHCIKQTGVFGHVARRFFAMAAAVPACQCVNLTPVPVSNDGDTRVLALRALRRRMIKALTGTDWGRIDNSVTAPHAFRVSAGA